MPLKKSLFSLLGELNLNFYFANSALPSDFEGTNTSDSSRHLKISSVIVINHH